MLDKFKKITRFLNERAAKLKAYVDMKSMMKIPDDTDDDFQTILSNFDEFAKRFTSPYIDESNDFEFRDSNVDGKETVNYGQPEDKINSNYKINLNRLKIYKQNEKNAEIDMESSGKQPFNDDKIDNDDFAYPPGDFRFYKTPRKNGNITFHLIFIYVYFSF